LNYLWDKTVNELRRRVSGYDLGYFYDIAVPGDMRKHFSGPEDLPLVQDVDLLRASQEIGLLTDVGFTQVDNVRYMRNHASAAHPNQSSSLACNSQLGLGPASARSSRCRRIRSRPTQAGC